MGGSDGNDLAEIVQDLAGECVAVSLLVGPVLVLALVLRLALGGTVLQMVEAGRPLDTGNHTVGHRVTAAASCLPSG